MKKFLLLACLFLVVIFSSAFSLTDWRSSIYEQIKTETIKGIKDNFRTNVRIGKVTGIIAGQIVFEDVVIPKYARAKKIYINYNLIKFALYKDIVPAISKITIEDGEFDVVRDRADHINILSLIPQAEPGGPKPPPFRAKLAFKNCRIKYKDLVGFRKNFRTFSEDLSDLNGTISFQQKDKIKISLSAKTKGERSPTQLKITGTSNLKTGQYGIEITAQRVDVEKWVNYTVPFDPLIFKGGEANIVMKLAPPKTPGWPVSLVGNFTFYNGSARIGGYNLDRAFGNLSMVDDSLALKDLAFRINTVPLTVNGRFFDFVKQKLDFKISLKDAQLRAITALFPPTKNLDVRGLGNASVTITGTASNPYARGTVTVKQGRFYNQRFFGSSGFKFGKGRLDINLSNLNLYKGRLVGKCWIDFSQPIPAFSLAATLKRIDLNSLAQNTPGIVGQASGELSLAGPLNDLKGRLSTGLSKASFFGQPLEDITGAFKIREGTIYVEHLSAISKTASLKAVGNISSDLTFDFKAQAQGIKLAGEGLLGKMATTVDDFDGNISWKLNDAFLASPIKNLTASGQVKLSNGQVGEQKFDIALGKIVMGHGLIKIEDVILNRRESMIKASGQTGIGHPTRLLFSGNKVNLADLKILNYVLPEEAQNPQGTADINFKITGELPPETELTSLDPLFDLDASGELNLYNVNFAEVPVKFAKLKVLWQERRLSFPQGRIETPKSHLSLKLNYQKDNILGSIYGIIDLNEFKSLTAKYGKISGQIGLNLVAEGPVKNPGIGATFWLENFRFNTLELDKVSGAATYAQDQLKISQPIYITKDTSRFKITGLANFADQLEESYLNLDIKVLEADLATVIGLSEKLQAEYARKAYAPTKAGKVQVNLSDLDLPTYQQFIKQENINLYSANGKRDCFLKTWGNVFKQLKKEEALTPEEYLGGDLKGEISLKGPINNLAGEFNGEVNKGRLRDFSFDKLEASASLLENKIKIDQFELNKKRGKLKTSGEIGFDNTFSLDVTAQNFPLDILRIVFDKEFKGNFTMNASFFGPVNNPDFSASFVGNNISLAEVPFDKVSTQITKRDGAIFIHDLSLINENKLSQVYGSLNLSPAGKVDLEASLHNNALGLFNLITNDIKWKQGHGTASLKIGGTMAKLDINGKISLSDGTAYVRLIDANIRNITGEATIVNSQLTIPKLAGFWQGATSKGYPNFVGLTGTIDLAHLLAQKRRVALDLTFSPTLLYVDLPNLYSGSADLTLAQLSGPLYFDFSKGPTLKVEAKIDNAVITLSKSKERKGKVFPLNFDVTLDLNKNVYASMGDVATFDLSNIFMNLEIKSQDLKISGNLEYPSLLGKIFLKRGSVTIFNREFDLLKTEQQEKYYPFNAEKVVENVAVFTGEKGKEGLMPDVSLVAKVEVENQEQANDQTVIKRVIILSHLKGVIGAKDKDRGLQVSFDSFVEDKSKSSYAMQPAGYSEQDIKVMLLPDFIKSLTGVSKGDNAEVDTNVVLADYISSRLQTVVFRGLERELEQKLGLESLTLEYNFGKDVRQAMGVSEQRALEGEKPDWRVGFVKGLFDNFYLEVNYSQFTTDTESPAEDVFNYQLTYKLSQIWSIIYYREPASLQQLTSGYQKITLKAGFSFW